MAIVDSIEKIDNAISERKNKLRTEDRADIGFLKEEAKKKRGGLLKEES